MLHLWYALPGVRSRKAFVIFFISLVVILYLESACFIQSGCDWDVDCFYGTFFKKLSKWGEQKERIRGVGEPEQPAVAQCCHCLWRQGRIEAENASAYFQFYCWSFFRPVRDGHAGVQHICVCALLSVPQSQYPKLDAQVQEVRQFFKSAWNENSIFFSKCMYNIYIYWPCIV